MERPNVLFVVLDSLRKDRVSAYSEEVDFTENLEELAEESTVYSDAVANAPWTLPSHASIFTGLYPWEHGATQRNLELDVEKELLAERFSKEGYRTACITTNGWLSGRFGLTRGFDSVDNLSSGLAGRLTQARRMLDGWLSSPGLGKLKRALVSVSNTVFHYWAGGSRTPDVVEKAEDFMEGEEPYFLFLNLMDAHEPCFPPKEYLERHGCVDPGEVCQNPTEFYSGREVEFEEVGKVYDASVDFMDDQLGRLLDHIRERGEWDDTVIVAVSDHGQMLGEENHYGHQYSVGEPLVSVPMIVKGGGSGERVDRQVELREIYHLLPDVAGLEESYEEGTGHALGGYEFPDLQRPRIPRDRWSDLYRRHSFARSSNGRITRTEEESGEEHEEFEEFEGLDDEERGALRESLESVGSSRSGKQLDEKDEEIQRKLRDLGYG